VRGGRVLIEEIYQAISGFFRIVQMTPEQIVSILIVPILVDMPRTFGKAIILISKALYDRFRKRRFGHGSPLVSVIVPAHNEEKVIAQTIDSLLRQDYPNLEVIVVDDGSTDRTGEIAQNFASKGLIKLVRREKASGSKARAVNYGIPFSRGEIIVTVDADTILEPSSIFELVEAFSNPAVGGVSGNIRVLNRVNLLTRLQAYEYLVAMEAGRRFQAISGALIIIPGAFGGIRRRLAYSIGFFDPDTITEDFDITLKVHKSRMKVVFASRAIGWTVVPESWRGWIRQRTRWTAGQLQTLIKHRNVFFEPFFRIIGLLVTPDMLFMDIVLLFVRTLWLITLPLFYLQLLPQLFILIFLFYLLNELVIAATAALLSPKKRDITCLPLIPIIVLFYRPFYGLVRIKAYLEEMSGMTFKW